MSNRSHDDETTADDVAGQATTMTVLGTTTFGRSNLQFLEGRPIPQLGGPNVVLIRVLYSDVNPVDHHKVRAFTVDIRAYLSFASSSAVLPYLLMPLRCFITSIHSATTRSST